MKSLTPETRRWLQTLIEQMMGIITGSSRGGNKVRLLWALPSIQYIPHPAWAQTGVLQ